MIVETAAYMVTEKRMIIAVGFDANGVCDALLTALVGSVTDHWRSDAFGCV